MDYLALTGSCTSELEPGAGKCGFEKATWKPLGAIGSTSAHEGTATNVLFDSMNDIPYMVVAWCGCNTAATVTVDTMMQHMCPCMFNILLM